MNAVIEQQAVSPQTLEHVLGTGDLSKLSTQQRVEYYARTCQSLGLNPLTRPFRFLALNGQITLYATRDATDQLRKVNGITLHVVDKQLDGDLFVVTVRARDKHGREDEDMGAVTLGALRGESRANALMKALTKAKRRVTLSICGLGLTDEAELDTMPGAQVFEPDEEIPAPVAPIRSAAIATPRPPQRSEAAPRAYTDDQWRTWLDKTRAAMELLRSRQEVVEVGERESVANATANGPEWLRRELSALLVEHYARFPDEQAEDELPELAITGEHNVAAG